MMVDRNASIAKKGFNYQDFVALYLFLQNPKELEEINDEGDEDISIIYRDGTEGFYQVKSVNKSDKILEKKVLKKAFDSLLEAYTRDANIKELVVVSNSDVMFGSRNTPSSLRNQTYGKLSYNDLNTVSINKINKILDDILKENPIKINKNHLKFMKLSYEGDEGTKLAPIFDKTKEFLSKINAQTALATNLVSILQAKMNLSSENKHLKLTKRDLATTTFGVVIKNAISEDDFDVLEIPYQEEDATKNFFEQISHDVFDYRNISEINREFTKFKQENLQMRKRSEQLRAFIENYAPIFLKNKFPADCELDNVSLNGIKILILHVVKNIMIIEKVTGELEIENN